MSLRTRSTSTKDQSSEPTKTDAEPLVQPDSSPDKSDPAPSFSQTAITQTLAGTAHLANLLPTGTLLAFQLLTPIFSSNGNCDPITRLLTQLLLLTLATSCFLGSFTDSFKSPEGQLYYGFATTKGMLLFDYPAGKALPDLSKYKLRPIDWIHAVLSVFVFAAVALRDKNVVSCLYPKAEKETQEVLDIVPVGIGLLCSMLFLIFPTKRHGIGYPVTSPN